MIEFKQVNKHYGKLHVLQSIDLHVARGEVVVICGPSGSGKSTLIRTVNRLEAIDSGDILVDGRSVFGSATDLQILRQKIGFVFQQFNLYPHLSVLDNVTLAPRKRMRLGVEPARRRALALLDRVGLADRASDFPVQLSGGQQQRVAIARAMALEPEILLFDEPTSALDPETIGDVLDVMKSLARDGLTMMVVTHEMGFAREVSDQVVFIDQGRILEHATPAVFFRQPAHPRAQQFLRQVRYPWLQGEVAA